MRARPLAVPGCFLFTPASHRDERGLFVSPLQEPAFVEQVGHPLYVAQTNHIRSKKGVLRGIHFTATPPGQTKYVHCAHGKALDVIIDLRVGSPTFGEWDMVEVDDRSFRAIYMPVGTGHAFLALEDDTVMSYLVSTSYRRENEHAITPFDPDIRIPWPDDMQFTLSERDVVAPTLAEARDRGILPVHADCVPDAGHDMARGDR